MTEIYQKNFDIQTQDIAKNIHISGQAPHVILLVAPCRSGSTAYTRVFNLAGLPTYDQPIKGIVRNRMQNLHQEWHIPSGTNIFVKETLGPYTETESTLNMIDILQKANFPMHKLSVVCLVRDPLATLSSWLRYFSDHRDENILFENFISSYKCIQSTLDSARNSDARIAGLTYESIRDESPIKVTKKIFDWIGIDFNELAVSEWQHAHQLNDPDLGIISHYEPDIYCGRQYYQKVRDSNGLQYNPAHQESIYQIPAQWLGIIEEKNLAEIYTSVKSARAAWFGHQQ